MASPGRQAWAWHLEGHGITAISSCLMTALQLVLSVHPPETGRKHPPWPYGLLSAEPGQEGGWHLLGPEGRELVIFGAGW